MSGRRGAARANRASVARRLHKRERVEPGSTVMSPHRAHHYLHIMLWRTRQLTRSPTCAADFVILNTVRSIRRQHNISSHDVGISSVINYLIISITLDVV